MYRSRVIHDYRFNDIDLAWFVVGRQGLPCVICEDTQGNLLSFRTPEEANQIIENNQSELGLMNIMNISIPIMFNRLQVDVDVNVDGRKDIM